MTTYARYEIQPDSQSHLMHGTLGGLWGCKSRKLVTCDHWKRPGSTKRVSVAAKFKGWCGSPILVLVCRQLRATTREVGRLCRTALACRLTVGAIFLTLRSTRLHMRKCCFSTVRCLLCHARPHSAFLNAMFRSFRDSFVAFPVAFVVLPWTRSSEKAGSSTVA